MPNILKNTMLSLCEKILKGKYQNVFFIPISKYCVFYTTRYQGLGFILFLFSFKSTMVSSINDVTKYGVVYKWRHEILYPPFCHASLYYGLITPVTKLLTPSHSKTLTLSMDDHYFWLVILEKNNDFWKCSTLCFTLTVS